MPNNQFQPRYIVFAAIMVLIYMAGAFQLEVLGEYSTAVNRPSSVTHADAGVKAAYDLLQSMDVPVARSSSRWSNLSYDTSVLFAFQPFARQPDADELKRLTRWVEDGGTLVLSCSQSPETVDPNDPLTGDVAQVASTLTKEIPCAPEVNNAMTKDIHQIAVQGNIRLASFNAKVYTTLFKDPSGAVAIAKSYGKGRVVLIANTLFASNNGIGKADNAVFFFNLAKAGNRTQTGAVAFDEYHQGIGFAEDATGPGKRIVALLPTPMKWISVLSIILCIVLASGTASRHQQAALQRDPPRHAVDHVRSLARLYEKSNAYGLALRPIYATLIHDLRHRLAVLPSETEEQLLAMAAVSEQFAAHMELLRNIVGKCSNVGAAVSLTSTQLIEISALIDQFRRDTGLVGYR